MGNNGFLIPEKKTSIFECKFLQACSFGKGAERKKSFIFIAGKWKHKPGEKGRNCKESCFFPLLLISAKEGGPWLGDFYGRPSIILPQSFSVTLGFAKSAKKCKIIPRHFGRHAIFNLDLRAFSFSVLDSLDMWGERIFPYLFYLPPPSPFSYLDPQRRQGRRRERSSPLLR